MDETRFNELKAKMEALVERAKNSEAVSRLAREQREGRTGPLDHTSRPQTTRQAPATEDDGLWFSQAAERREAAEREHAARRRRADAETSSRDRLHARLRDLYGTDQADRMMP